MDKLLKLLASDARLSPEQLSALLKKDVADVKRMIESYENSGVILGYRTEIDWDRTDREYVTALIELKVTPQRDRGFDKVAEKIYHFPEVQSLYLMSGSYDLCVIIEGKTIKEVALFVAEKLAPMEAVVSTATHFVLKKYKDNGVIYNKPEPDERENCN